MHVVIATIIHQFNNKLFTFHLFSLINNYNNNKKKKRHIKQSVERYSSVQQYCTINLAVMEMAVSSLIYVHIRD